ncbi:Gfo/Idh/MocA family protein [Streptomyces sp. NPDC057611]|uniref:Gfo/Idh/MocA family protein n=1 Tax=Streptomyces sp. NPDC057611 TaxID=3346182 RepID=UPI0036B8D0B5
MIESTDFAGGDRATRLDRPLTIAVLGAGARGAAYAELAARRPREAKVVAVAEPQEQIRTAVAARHGIEADLCFDDWRALLHRPRLADAAIIAIQDAEHMEAAVALADLGYHLLLEKPMATSEEDCERIAESAHRNGTALSVAHVMRYTPYTVALKEVLSEGAIGDIVSMEHLEPIGYYHFAHSFVRGSWRREDASTFLLMSKSCHDLDWISYIVGQPVSRVASFGSRSHFRLEAAPEGSTDRCVTCPVESECAYSAKRVYLSGLRNGGTKQYFTKVMSGGQLTEEAVATALAEGPYGRCVYRSDNDVVDHQVVSLEFEGGATASFTLAAFTPLENRHTKIFGSRGQLTGDGRYIHVYDFLTERTTVIDTSRDGSSAAEGHAGGDEALFHHAFVDALHGGRPELIASGIEASLDSHRIVFAAERARRTGQVVQLDRTHSKPGGNT